MNWIYNKTAIISGASSGIGKEVAKLLITKYNCKVLGLARTESKLIAFKEELGELGNNFSYYPMDVGSVENWNKLAQYIQDNNINPDILINNAGTMTPFESFDKMSEEQVQKVFNTNFLSITYSVRALLPIIKKSSTPAIINISSASALGCLPGVSIYSASKSALKTFSEILHAELRGQVFVSTIMPGFIKTNLFYSKDNAKDIIESKDKKIIEFFSMPVEKLAKKVVRIIKRKKARAILGIDAKALNIMYKTTPQTSGRLIGWVMRKTKMKTFENIYNKEK